MSQKAITWPDIVAAARELGAGEWAIYKWKQRGRIPGEWRIDIARHLNTDPSVIATPQQEHAQ